jgi:hypothetical protein
MERILLDFSGRRERLSEAHAGMGLPARDALKKILGLFHLTTVMGTLESPLQLC